MKRLKSLFLASILFATNLCLIFTGNTYAANANDFKFKDYTVDFYLSKNSSGVSEMSVEETFVAVFPNKNQNHGIERMIPFLNQNDSNLTVEDLSNFKIEVTRNGATEPYSVYTGDDYFKVRIGDADVYVKGEQTYKLKYKFIRVITDFSSSFYSTEPYQELYWDSNGTGWSQTFENATVNLHIDQSIRSHVKSELKSSSSSTYKDKSTIHSNNETKDKLAAWCYVGRQGSSNQNRCSITDIADGISFHTDHLYSGENLTFVANFDANTFNVPKNVFTKKLTYDSVENHYYITKDVDGVINMHVKEDVTATFPTLNIEQALTVNIPFVDRNGTRYTTEKQDTIDVKATFDGQEIKPIVEKEDGYFQVALTNSKSGYEYLHDTHHIIFEYDIKNIVLDEETRQSTYWQSRSLTLNGTYDSITAYYHVDKSLLSQLDEKTGAECVTYKSKDGKTVNRQCEIKKTDDGFMAKVTNMSSYSMLGVSLFFKPNTFVIPPENHNSLCVWIFCAVIAFLAFICIIFYFKTYTKSTRQKLAFKKNLPVIAQYVPHPDFTVAQLAAVYAKPTRNNKVATMLELIVGKKIELIKGTKKLFGGYNWKAKVVSLDGLSKEQEDLLRILNGGSSVSLNSEISLQAHAYSSSLSAAFSNYTKHTTEFAETAGCLEPKKKTTVKSLGKELLTLLLVFFIIGIIFIALSAYEEIFALFCEITNFSPYSVFDGQFLIPIAIGIALFVFIMLPYIASLVDIVKKRTEKGLEISNYAEGLHLYIKMAEADRIKFLQSVNTVDTSPEGIVKLHEKLLPYAALFGLEKSWMKELSKYYVEASAPAPDWYNAGFTYAIASSVMRSAVSSPSAPSSGGGWSGSSGHSGGGGGGFSGGGGGGGGGGGW